MTEKPADEIHVLSEEEKEALREEIVLEIVEVIERANPEAGARLRASLFGGDDE